ncbi:protein-glutamine gamma-glutamyltransferase K-like isoform X1 [Argopecten irradians]|uniref:protein-glutamine gamma-glutamyltransferase K-like isoform X1 n=1 Tax=Argopecten irradians TaxID=31199 RepID=UPI0037136564
MLSNARRADEISAPPRETRRYGPHRVSYDVLMELKYYRELYLVKYNLDICDYSPYHLYRRFLDDESLFGTVNSDDEDDADEDDLNSEIHLKKVDLNIKQNAVNHHTDKYKCISKRIYEGKEEPAALVVRRGQIFTTEMTFDRDYDAKIHDLQMKFRTGLNPLAPRGTEVIINIDEDGNKINNSSKWQARVASKMPAQTLDIEIYSPYDCIVGKWDMHVYTISKDKRGGGKKKLHYKHDEDIFILFNAWCKDDDVYFPEDPDFETDVDPRDEYVLNPSGAIYESGTWPKAWRFGQFEEDILQISLKLVSRYFDGDTSWKMGNVCDVARGISAMVNANDDRGMIIGRWDNKYDDGTNPYTWVSSPKILWAYRDHGPVKYGQCWVFAAVTVTVCRALGIPCRPISNYLSAHDVDRTNQVEKIKFSYEDEFRSMSGDSIWNFHVWNEIWTRRRDLQTSEFDGWQIIDATPQEESDGLMQCGPSPQKAVKQGLTYIPSDTAFVFTEVNADIACFEQTGVNDVRRVKTVENGVGKNMSTKKPDGLPLKKGGYEQMLQRLEITSLYKHRERTADERIAVARAMRHAGNTIEDDIDPEEVNIKIQTKKAENEMYLGEDIEFSVIVKNVSDDTDSEMEISRVAITLSSTDYTGHNQKRITKEEIKHVSLTPGEERSFDILVPWTTYKGYRQDSNDYSITAVATAAKSGKSNIENKIITLRNADVLEVHSIDNCIVGQDVEVKVSLTNVIPMTLTKCVLKFETECFHDYDDIALGTLEHGDSFTKTISMRAIRAGRGQIIVVLDTLELANIKGFVDINVSE